MRKISINNLLGSSKKVSNLNLNHGYFSYDEKFSTFCPSKMGFNFSLRDWVRENYSYLLSEEENECWDGEEGEFYFFDPVFNELGGWYIEIYSCKGVVKYNNKIPYFTGDMRRIKSGCDILISLIKDQDENWSEGLLKKFKEAIKTGSTELCLTESEFQECEESWNHRCFRF